MHRDEKEEMGMEVLDFKEIEKCSSVYVYGYSNMGRNVYRKLSMLFPEKCKGIMVSKHSEKTKKIINSGENSIFEVKEVKADFHVLVIVALNPLFHKTILETLTKNGFYKILVYDEILDEEINKRLIHLPKLEIRFLNICVGQACNFKCRDCANMAPYAQKENMRYSLESIKRDVDAVLPFFSLIDTLHIQGGESFLYSELPELLYFLRENYGNVFKNLQIATNGTVLPNRKIIKAMKDTHAGVRISDYAVKNDIEKFEMILADNEIPFQKYKFVGKNGTWSYTGSIDDIDLKNESLLGHIQSCSWATCYTVENGLVGRCARSIPAITLQNMEIDNDYLDLRKNNTVSQVSKYFMFIQPMKCCNKCMGSRGEVIPAAIQMKKEEV